MHFKAELTKKDFEVNIPDCRTAEISVNNLASCSDIDIGSIGMICCANNDIFEPDGGRGCEKSDPCQNGGKCVTLRSEPGYKCNCPKILTGIFKGYPSHIGPDCEEEESISRKSSNPVVIFAFFDGAGILKIF